MFSRRTHLLIIWTYRGSERYFSGYEMVEFPLTLVLWILVMTTDDLDSTTTSLSREMRTYNMPLPYYLAIIR